ncbi:MAG: bifunctional folylpolyglutamate synthase/dihydrofolate synthase, partial [Candidatus Saccharimonadales bacterium]
AGTSGKTSTAYYMAALLAAIGKKTGLSVSPHVDSITERVQVNGQPVDDSSFCKELGIFLDIVHHAAPKPTYFELLYAFMIWYMVKVDMDYVVVETGVGGLFDATNVSTREDKVCLITDIGFDHMDLLGDTLGEIAAQKAGIIHPGNHVFMYEQGDEVMDAITSRCGQQGATLHAVDESYKDRAFPVSLPLYQRRNWFLAYSAYEYLRDRDALAVLDNNSLDATCGITVPGRMELFKLRGKTIVMDGAHNGQKIRTFADSLRRLFPNKRPAVLLALKDGKDRADFVREISELASRVVATRFDGFQDLPLRSVPAKELAASFTDIPAVGIADQSEAYKALLDGPEDILLITGSFYLIGQLRNKGLLR